MDSKSNGRASNGTPKCVSCTISSPSNRMDSSCLPCKRSLQQKEKEAWLALSKDTKPIKTDVETNETLLSIANKALVSRLECPVCYQLMVPPLRQCRSGHSICSRCNTRLHRCPTCRRSFIDTSNIILNEICLVVAIPCRYYQEGCQQLVRLVDKAHHEEECIWKQYDCPEDCDYKGSRANVVDHVTKEHSGTVSKIFLGQITTLRYTYGPINPIEETSVEVEFFNTVSRTVLLLDESGDSRQVFVFSLKYDSVGGSLSGVLRCIGSTHDALSYSYKMKMASSDKRFKISSTTVCVGCDVSVDEVVSAGRVMKIDGQVFKKFVNDDGKFFVSIKIVNNDQTEKINEA